MGKTKNSHPRHHYYSEMIDIKIMGIDNSGIATKKSGGGLNTYETKQKPLLYFP